jgi:flagellar hook assembly protein FlgD
MITYELQITNEVDLSIYNVLGQKVATLVSGKQTAGSHQVEWDASAFASGVYYYVLKTGEFRDVRKMVLIK